MKAALYATCCGAAKASHCCSCRCFVVSTRLYARLCRCRVQAALPFKSKPKIQAPRKRKNLEQKRAIPLEPAERKAVSLYAQLNAIRNEKAEKRRAQQSRRRVVRTGTRWLARSCMPTCQAGAIAQTAGACRPMSSCTDPISCIICATVSQVLLPCDAVSPAAGAYEEAAGDE